MDDMLTGLRVPMPAPSRDLSAEAVECLTFDLASGIHSAETIAQRYGFETPKNLQKYLLGNLWLHEKAKHLRALLESDQNTGKRVQLKGLYGCEETIPDLVGIIKNPMSAPKDKIDAYKELRQSGGLGIAGKEGSGGGTQFSLVINMPHHTEKLLTTVVSQPAAGLVDESEGE
jgi:hypothetical protein